MNDQLLNTIFLDLQSEFQAKNIKVLLGGGFGLYLKQLDLLNSKSINTLLSIDAWPLPRSTSDLDLFFPIEVLVNLNDMQAIRQTIDDLNFTPIEGSKFWQFVHSSSGVKIDLLTGAVDDQRRPLLKIDHRRARPKGKLKLHARYTPEALELSSHQETIAVKGLLSNGLSHEGEVHLPSPFTYLMMKITAFGDQVENRNKDLGRHHALDVYRIVAMLTEEQYAKTINQMELSAESPYCQRVKQLTDSFFNAKTALGILRMKEHEFYKTSMDLDVFIVSLNELIALPT